MSSGTHKRCCGDSYQIRRQLIWCAADIRWRRTRHQVTFLKRKVTEAVLRIVTFSPDAGTSEPLGLAYKFKNMDVTKCRWLTITAMVVQYKQGDTLHMCTTVERWDQKLRQEQLPLSSQCEHLVFSLDKFCISKDWAHCNLRIWSLVWGNYPKSKLYAFGRTAGSDWANIDLFRVLIFVLQTLSKLDHREVYNRDRNTKPMNSRSAKRLEAF